MSEQANDITKAAGPTIRLTIRPRDGFEEGRFYTGSELEVLVNGVELDGIMGVEIAPISAAGGLVQATLHMVVQPDIDIPVVLTKPEDA